MDDGSVKVSRGMWAPQKILEKKIKSYLEIAKSKLFSCNFRTMRQRLKFELKLNSDVLVATPPNVKPPPLEELEAPEKDKM